MKIQQQNSYNPNMKALYFTKARPLYNSAIKYCNEKITDQGTKYVEDNSAKLTPIIKEAFTENSFIKKMAEKYETFVQYMGEKYDMNMGGFKSSARIYVTKTEKDVTTSDSYTYSAKDVYSPNGARLKLFADIEQNLSFEELNKELGCL